MTTFSNQQVSQVSARQLNADMEYARKEYNKGNSTPLVALGAAHIGNETVEKFIQKVIKDKHVADYKAWLPQEGWH
jgi:hypothetical protein